MTNFDIILPAIDRLLARADRLARSVREGVAPTPAMTARMVKMADEIERAAMAAQAAEAARIERENAMRARLNLAPLPVAKIDAAAIAKAAEMRRIAAAYGG